MGKWPERVQIKQVWPSVWSLTESREDRVHALCYSLYFSIFCLHLKFSLIKSETGEFHDGLGVSTPGFHCRGLGSIPIRELSSCNLAAEPQKNTTPWLRIFVPSGKSKLSSWFSSIFYTQSRNHHSSLNSAFLYKHWVSQHPRFPPSFVCGWIMESCLLPPGSFLFSST